MRILARPLLAGLLAAVGMVLAGRPEKPPEPRTAAPVVTPPAAAASGPAPAAVTPRGLPDFTHLVDRVGPAVVNVTALARVARSHGDANMPPEYLEFFSRFLPNAPDERVLRGPLLNLAGEVVGINSQFYTRTGSCMGVSFAIPIEVALKVSEEPREHGFVTRGRIGVVVQPMTPEIAERPGPDGRRVVAELTVAATPRNS